MCNPRSTRELLWLTWRVKRVLFTHAPGEARQLGHNHIGTEHLLLGLLHEDDATTADLTALGTGPPQVRQAILGLLPGHRRPPAPAEDTVSLLLLELIPGWRAAVPVGEPGQDATGERASA